jgi:hypothetical protein
MKLKNILLTLALVMGSLTVFGQTTAPDATKPYVIFDSTYALESTTSSSNTSVDIYYDNTSGTAVKGIQFSFSYDNTVFDTPTVTYNNTSGPAGYLSTDVNNGIVKVVWVYTGASTTFDLIAGNMFSVELPFDANYTNGSVTGMDFTTDLTAYYATAAGTDAALGTSDNGGNFVEPAFDYTATILNSPSNPADSIDVILQKSSDGNSWTDVTTVTTDANGEAVFSENLDQAYWQIRIKIESGLDASSALSTADANMIAQIAAGVQNAAGVQWYTANPNQATGITVSDSYLVFSRLAQGNTSYPSTPDVLFFTEAQYNTIDASNVDPSTSIPGQTEFLSPQINNTTAGNFYLLILGDANGTGLN